MTRSTHPLTIRLAAPDDHLALARLAALDSADRILPGRVLLAEVCDEPRAALSLETGAAIADPFYPTAHLLVLLRAHAKGLEPRRRPRRLSFGYGWARARAA